MVTCGMNERSRLHISQTIGCSKFSMDKAHAMMKKFGVHLYLFLPMLDLDALEPTVKQTRMVETRGFLLLPHTMNTQHQNQQGKTQAQIIS